MGEMHLYAIGIDEFRDLFAGHAESARDLRGLAASAFPPPEQPRTVGLLDRLGPLFKRPENAPVIRPDVPTGHDLDDLVHGRDIAPERLTAAWTLIRLWLDAHSFGHVALPLDGARIEHLDFELGRVGVPSHLSMASLFNRKLGIPPKLLPGHAGGYTRAGHAVALRDAWKPILDEVDDETRSVARPLVTWLDEHEARAEKAHEAGRIPPDLVALYQP